MQAESDVIFRPSAIIFVQIGSGVIRTELAAVAEGTVASHREQNVIHLETALTEVREMSK